MSYARPLHAVGQASRRVARVLLPLAVVLLAFYPASPAQAASGIPVGFNPYWALGGQDLADIGSGWPNYDGHGLQAMRDSVWWGQIEPTAPTRPCSSCALVHQYQWDGYDRKVGDLARSGIQWIPQVDGTPTWVAGQVHNGANPPTTNDEFEAFRDYVSAAARRYGPSGSFWAAHPDVPYRPVRSWEVWNEPNLDLFFGGQVDPALYARVLRTAATAIKEADPSGEVIVGGLAPFETDTPGRMSYASFLRGVFAADPAVRDLIDSVADHPYSGSPRSTVAGAIAFREVVNANVPNGSQLGLWINEFGWGTQGACDWLCAGPPSSGWLDPGTEASYEATQARWLTDAINGMMVRRQSLNLRGLMMWTLADQPTDANHHGTFNDDNGFNFTGLLRTPRPWSHTDRWPTIRDLAPKPAWDAVRELVASGTYTDPWPGQDLRAPAPTTRSTPQPQPAPAHPTTLIASDLRARLGWQRAGPQRRGTVILTARRIHSDQRVAVCGTLTLYLRRHARRLAVGTCRPQRLGSEVRAGRTLRCARGTRGSLTGRIAVRSARGQVVWSRALRRAVRC